ncbi:MAG: hypothetical protein KGJ24_03470, partial [Burkholderiales bacterium]|nr:hypothetical protein [Burkholderiales bacterium]
MAAASALGAGFAPAASAATCTWNPAAGNWNTAAAWSCGAVPGAADTADIGATKAVTINSAQTVQSLNNAGSVNIDAFLLTLGGGGSTTNTGTLNVGAGPNPNNAALNVSVGHNVNNTGGVINISADSVLNQFGSTLTGGTINTTGTGKVVAYLGNNYLDGVTLNGVLDLATAGNARENVINGLTLNGSANIANGGILSLDSAHTSGGNQTIAGTGSINLNDAGARLSLEGTGTTTLGTGITVRGQGNIGQPAYTGGNNTLVNDGLISADVSGGTLEIVPPAGSGSVSNNGTLQATGGGTLKLSTNVANSGLIVAHNGSGVLLNGASVSGGTLASLGTGAIAANGSGNNFLNGVTLSAGSVLDLTSQGNARERIAGGATLNGAVNVANGGVLSLDSSTALGPNQTIGGTGTINLNDASARLAIEATGSTTLGSGLTVRGQGNIGTPAIVGGNNVLTNDGLISAEVSGKTLQITAPASVGSVVNNGTLQAINGAVLQLSTSINSNPGGQIIAGAGSQVVQNNVTLNGALNASGSGVFSADGNGGNFLNAATLNGVLDLASIANAHERIINGATINGAVNVSNGGILVLDSANTSGGNQTVAGTATINLNDANARLGIDGTGNTTLGSGITVRGQGNIGSPVIVGGSNVLTNNGLISADVSGGTLSITAP